MTASLYRSKLNGLILLGLVCTGFTFQQDRPWVPVVYGVGGLLALGLRRRQLRRRAWLEGVLLFGAIALAYQLGGRFGPNRLVFVANALGIYQVCRLVWAPTARQQQYAVAVTLMQLAVGSMVIVEPERFLPVLVLAVYLLPGALREIQTTTYGPAAAAAPRPRRAGGLEFAVVAALTAVFFVAFPRLGGLHRFAPPVAPPGALMGPTSSRVDMVRSPADEGSDRLVCRVQGEDLGYLRCLGLDQFDGRVWSPGNRSFRIDPSRPLQHPVTPELQYRRVKVLASPMLDKVFPADGFVVRVAAPVRSHVYVAEHGGVTTTHPLPPGLTYEYWTLPGAPPQAFGDERQRRWLTDLGSFVPSPPLRRWFDELTAGETDPAAIAAKFEAFFQNNFTYELGGPDLDREAPLDDFILRERRGHCQRYASALAVLLRLAGIPSRVVLGFVPQEYNPVAEFYNIRAKHAHAWTEAWLPGRGWVQFDATPYGRSVPVESRGLTASIFEWFEDRWYAKVVEFDLADQAQVGGVVSGTLARLGALAFRHLPWLALALVALGVGLILSGLRWPGWPRRAAARPVAGAAAVAAAQAFYARLLQALARRGYRRPATQTPREFAAWLAAERHPEIAAIRVVTAEFCHIRYGNRELSEPTRAALEGHVAAVAASPARYRSAAATEAQPRP